ncbi:GCN5-related N-acetyltransferase [Microbacterium sp. C448]|uniref:GNAT family N-acetyltransferase n=1 Tax=Microbacterium sp. C448 TaxID=1177594 RepID=UPI0003DE5186|nr:GNAT family N-acetyltransferase [Microbacterium sp. C448]CDK01236.1 GCN5-related N-acetyltransferase [Microbacterium sp. C448]
MVRFIEMAPDAPVAHGLLTEYFAARAEVFPGGGYRPTYPDPSVFVAPDGVFLVIEDEGAAAGARRPVGCGGIRRIPDGPAGVRYEVKHLYLDPSTRGRGWGRLLLDELERRARTWGAAQLVLDTHHTLEAAGGLYASAGFEPIAPYNDNPNATRWYGKALG